MDKFDLLPYTKTDDVLKDSRQIIEARSHTEESISDCQHSSGRAQLAAWKKNFGRIYVWQ